MPQRPPALTRRRLLSATAAASLIGSTTGCWGSFNLTGKVYDWNGHFDSKWASWAIFLVFIILPVYGLLLFIDALIINTIEFYSGKNPVSRAAIDGEHHLVMRGAKGDPSRVEIEHKQGEQTVRTMKVERLGLNEFRLLDADNEVVTQVEVTVTGGARLRDGEGREIATLRRKDFKAINRAVAEGQSPSEAMWNVLDEQATMRMLAFSDAIQSRRWV